MSEFWAQAAALVWGPMTVALLMGTGIYLSFRLKFIHLRHFRLGWRFAAQGNEIPARTQGETSSPPGDISPLQSLMTMLAGAIGNGNIAGVATAIAIGGPGAIFWMWASGLFAMATKYSEAVLGLAPRAFGQAASASHPATRDQTTAARPATCRTRTQPTGGSR
jgi:AGCS family alanine or glycine:cation symporter